MTDTDPAFEQAAALHRAGQYAPSADACRRLLEERPEHPGAWHLWGRNWMEQGRPDQAIACFSKAVELAPRNPACYGGLGRAARAIGKLDLATLCFQQALLLGGETAELHLQLAETLHDRGLLEEAENAYRQSLQLDDAQPAAQNGLGVLLQSQGRFDEAADCYGIALKLAPHYLEASTNLGNTLASLEQLDAAATRFDFSLTLDPAHAPTLLSLGNLRKKQDRPEQAEQAYRRAIECEPDLASAHFNLGCVLRGQRRLDEAVACFRHALQLTPAYCDALNNLGLTLDELGDSTEAKTCFLAAIDVEPENHAAWTNLGTLAQKQGAMDEAARCFRRALAAKPDFAEAHLNLAMTLLSVGRFDEGWAEHEWRLKTDVSRLRPVDRPQWNGEPLDGKTILVRAEQGLGDTLQFVRYLPLLQRRGARVIFECQTPLVPLLNRCPGIDVLSTGETPVADFDVHLPLMSLPRLFGSIEASFPCVVPYLTPDPALVERWRRRLEDFPGCKVGVNWQGNPKYGQDRVRSIPFRQFLPLADLSGVRFFSLHKGSGRPQLTELADRWPVVDLADELDDATGAFMDTAAVMKNLDLVITSDTAIPHLAGALGVEVWMALPYVADWRWRLEGERCPWYPTMRLFRQSRPGDWTDVFQRIRDALRARTES